MSYNLTTDQIEHFREVFSVFDADGSGAIDGSELGSCLRALGQNLSEEELKELIMSVDDDQSGSIDFEEFLGMINSKTDAIHCEDEMLAAFQEFDIARKGKLPRYAPPCCSNLLPARPAPEFLPAWPNADAVFCPAFPPAAPGQPSCISSRKSGTR